MKTEFNKVFVLAGLTLLLAACGGGGGSSAPTVTEPTTQTFQVTVESITVTRLTSGDVVAVDTSALESATLTFTP